MSIELQELLVQAKAVAMKDAEVGRVLVAIVNHLAKLEHPPVQAKSSKGGNHGD